MRSISGNVKTMGAFGQKMNKLSPELIDQINKASTEDVFQGFGSAVFCNCRCVVYRRLEEGGYNRG